MSRLLLGAALLLVACPAPPVSTCVPGRQEVCACAVGTGFQTCESSGRFGPCSCFGAGGGGGSAVGGGGGSANGGGGGTAVGGGGGGAVARVDELVSGTRLRATAWVGADGARAAGIGFWDTQLQTYCAPSTLVYAAPIGGTASWSTLGSPRCVPIPLAAGVNGTFDGAGCTGTQLLMQVDYSSAGFYRLGSQPPRTQVGVLTDGGLVRVAELPAGAAFSTRNSTDGGCSAQTMPADGGLYGPYPLRYYRASAPLNESELAAGTDVTE